MPPKKLHTWNAQHHRYKFVVLCVCFFFLYTLFTKFGDIFQQEGWLLKKLIIDKTGSNVNEVLSSSASLGLLSLDVVTRYACFEACQSPHQPRWPACQWTSKRSRRCRKPLSEQTRLWPKPVSECECEFPSNFSFRYSHFYYLSRGIQCPSQSIGRWNISSS